MGLCSGLCGNIQIRSSCDNESFAVCVYQNYIVNTQLVFEGFNGAVCLVASKRTQVCPEAAQRRSKAGQDAQISALRCCTYMALGHVASKRPQVGPNAHPTRPTAPPPQDALKTVKGEPK